MVSSFFIEFYAAGAYAVELGTWWEACVVARRDPLHDKRESPWAGVCCLAESRAAGRVSDRGTRSVTDQVCQMTAALCAGM